MKALEDEYAKAQQAAWAAHPGDPELSKLILRSRELREQIGDERAREIRRDLLGLI